jgi:glucokinase
MSERAILVGDVGGTSVRFALAHSRRGEVSLSHVWKRPGSDFATFDLALDAWLAETKARPDGACFGMAGPVSGGQVRLLHRDWTVDRRALGARLGVERVVLVNDFFAMARSAPDLAPDQQLAIAPGEADAQGSIAVGGPGTGFGLAILRRFIDETPPVADGWVVVGGEGGHQLFTPLTELEWRLAERLRQTQGYVSNEVVTSGSGFEASLEALAAVMGAPHRDFTQAEVIDQARSGDELCLEFCRLRARAVMAAMGNAALLANTTGGVFIAGGVAARLAPWLKEAAAIARFRDRGPRTELLAKIPIRLITAEDAPLVGAARLWLDEEARGWL